MIDTMQSMWVMTGISAVVLAVTMLMLWRLKPPDSLALAFAVAAAAQGAQIVTRVLAQQGLAASWYASDLFGIVTIAALTGATLILTSRRIPYRAIAIVASGVIVSFWIARAAGITRLTGGDDLAPFRTLLVLPLAALLLFGRTPDLTRACRILGAIFFLIAVNRIAAVTWLADPTLSGIIGLIQIATNLGAFATGIVIVLQRRERAATRLIREVRDSESTFRAMLDNVPIGILLKGLDGRYVATNQNFVERYVEVGGRIIGSTADELAPLIGLSAAQLELMKADDAHIVNTHKAVVRELTVYPPGKKRRDAILTRFPVDDVEGKLTMVGLAVLDVTDLKSLERAAQLSQKMETLGRLAGGIAHDFNNLLTVIQGNLELLRERQAGQGDARALADRALHAASRSAELVNQLLLFSRQQILEPQAIDVGVLIGRMKDLLGSTIMETISVSISVPDHLWHALADPAQLENALLNLAFNARDAMPEGGALSIEAENVELTSDHLPTGSDIVPGSFVRIRVTDTGSGMPPEILHRAFEPFFTTKEFGKGSGLGLSMVYGFVKQWGGHIEIDSALGRGTRVDLYLRKTEPGRVFEALKGDVRAQGSGQTILVVEDNPDVRQVAVRFLREFGYRVIEAADGPAALAILDSDQAIDLLFTDIVMPGGMNGIELARRVMNLRPGIRHLFATGYADEIALDVSAHAMTGQILAKPYYKDDLARAVEGALKAPTYNRD